MIGEQTPEGRSIRLKPKGAARFVAAAFMVVWLCGWVAGECFALWLLVTGANSLITGTPPSPGRAPLQMGPALGIGAFLLFWLAMWTIGGLAAMNQLLQLLWSEDRLTVSRAGLTLVRARGPFRWAREFPRDTVRRIVVVHRRGCGIGLETDRQTVELTRLGTPQEREETAAALRSELALEERAPEPEDVVLPKGWEEAITPEGDRVLVPDAKIRMKQARVAGLVALALAAAAIAVIRNAVGQPALIPPAIMLTIFAAGAASGVAWLAKGRMEWKIGNGQVVLRRRFGSRAADLFEAQYLELIASSDSDGDEVFGLDAVKGVPGAAAVELNVAKAQQNRRRVAGVVNDSAIPRQLGLWLARAANVPFTDRTTPEARAAEMKVLRDQLENSGPLGRFAARLLSNQEDKGRKSA